MEYPKYQATKETALRTSLQLIKSGVFEFDIYENERRILRINLDKGFFSTGVLDVEETRKFLHSHSEIMSTYNNRFNEAGRPYEGWLHRQSGDYRFFYLYSYHPVRRFKDSDIDSKAVQVRNRIFDFKYDKTKGRTLTDHKRGLGFFVPKIEDVLRRTYGEDLKDIVLMCVPASTALGYEERNGDFSEAVCRDTGMMNAMGHVKYIKDGTKKHCGGGTRAVVELDKEFFKDKAVVVFDDVLTEGETMRECIHNIRQAGARVLGAICLGRTVRMKTSNNPYDEYMKIA